MALELARDEAVLGADEMEDRDHVRVARHGAARGEDDAEDGRDEDQDEDGDADEDGRVRHRLQPRGPGAMVVEAGAAHLRLDAACQVGEVDAPAGRTGGPR